MSTSLVTLAETSLLGARSFTLVVALLLGGTVEVKGKGTMHTYLVVGQRNDPLRTSIAAITPPGE